ncbi:hypothetical protein RRG08_014394 [Elysia crispata]|uniref:Uncharacterized protein n=1 Tax=Elysia crispata TaxID=231223 RepID=A0AAE0YN55_9GAST|nr:hypothetical protein RRG08_014394 [Elysia crispata]
MGFQLPTGHARTRGNYANPNTVRPPEPMLKLKAMRRRQAKNRCHTGIDSIRVEVRSESRRDTLFRAAHKAVCAFYYHRLVHDSSTVAGQNSYKTQDKKGKKMRDWGSGMVPWKDRMRDTGRPGWPGHKDNSCAVRRKKHKKDTGVLETKISENGEERQKVAAQAREREKEDGKKRLDGEEKGLE